MARFLLTLKKYWLPVYQYLQAKGITYWLKWSFITLACVEIIQRASLISWAGWIIRKPLPALLNYIIILAIFLVLNAILAHRRAATVLGFATMTLMAIVDYLKFTYMQEHLYPWDFFIFPEMLALLPSLGGSLFIAAILVLLLVPLTLYLLFLLLKQKQTRFFKRGMMLSASVFCLAVIVTAIEVPIARNYFDQINIKSNHLRNFKSNGFFLAFAFNIDPLIHIENPDNYSKEVIDRIIANPSPMQARDTKTTRPNVIIIMSEALFDPTQLPVSYSQDPLQSLKALQQEHGTSSVISPSHGGGTCNTEFEVLTGLSMSFLPRGSLPYQQYIRQTLPSLPHIFKDHGYATLAIHPFRQHFFSRESVYPLLGFDDYISVEDWHTPEYAGEFIADKDVTRKIIEFSETFDTPYFIFAVTMQNHLPFTTPHHPDFNVLDGDLSEKSRETLTSYIAGVHDADQSLLALIKHFEKSPTPTIIVFFGDHLPALHTVYEETKFFEDHDNPFVTHTVPALLWSNYKQIPSVQALSTFYLGGYVLEQADITPPLHFEFLRNLRQEYPVIFYEQAKDKDGDFHQTHALKYSKAGLQNLINDYWVLQHDLIFGEQYLAMP